MFIVAFQIVDLSGQLQICSYILILTCKRAQARQHRDQIAESDEGRTLRMVAWVCIVRQSINNSTKLCFMYEASFHKS
jgi:hypothetical protein